jgi:hypothetical protein
MLWCRDRKCSLGGSLVGRVPFEAFISAGRPSHAELRSRLRGADASLTNTDALCEAVHRSKAARNAAGYNQANTH